MENSSKAQVVVFRKHEEKLFVLLLQTNNKSGAFWQNVTGSVEAGEDFKEGAKRELLEETNIDSDVFDTGYEFSFTSRWHKNATEKCFYAFATSEKIKLSEEHQNYKWIDSRDITRNDYKFETNFIALTKAIACLE